MAKLVWDAQGERKFENGVCHGVLFKMKSDGTYDKGVAWNGLTSVTESPEGAEVNTIYADNIPYLNLLSAERFKATIEAYTYPEEFEECDGSKELVASSGVYATQQNRSKFAFCYETKIGNDTNPEAGYKIHIVYGCLAQPSERAHETINDSPEAMTMSWEVFSEPIGVENFKPISHIVIDSTKVPAAKLTTIKNNLYGTDAGQGGTPAATDPTLMLPDALITLLSANG